MDWKNLAQQGKYKEALAEFVKKGGVSFVEIVEEFEEFLPTRGDFLITPESNHSLVYWHGLSKEITNLLIVCFAERKIFAHPSNALVYMIDGQVPNLPIAQTNREYKEKHWVPVVLEPFPFVATEEKKTKKIKQTKKQRRKFKRALARVA